MQGGAKVGLQVWVQQSLFCYYCIIFHVFIWKMKYNYNPAFAQPKCFWQLNMMPCEKIHLNIKAWAFKINLFKNSITKSFYLYAKGFVRQSLGPCNREWHWFRAQGHARLQPVTGKDLSSTPDTAQEPLESNNWKRFRILELEVNL